MLEITKSGIYDITAEQYHADPCPKPSLSSSIANILSKKTAMHAKFAHPRLNPNFCEKSTSYFDFGRAMHSLLLEPNKGAIVQIDYPSWHTDKSKQERDFLKSIGKTAILSKDYNKARLMAEIARDFMRSTKIGPDFFGGQKEASLIAYDDCWLRGRLDCISSDRSIIFDYKTVLNAHPDNFVNYAVSEYGYDIQTAMYLELNKLIGFKGNQRYFWILQEKEEPYCCSLVEASESQIECGKRKLMLAKQQWVKCLASNEWPGYGNEAFYLDAPSWEIAKLEMLSA